VIGEIELASCASRRLQRFVEGVLTMPSYEIVIDTTDSGRFPRFVSGSLDQRAAGIGAEWCCRSPEGSPEAWRRPGKAFPEVGGMITSRMRHGQDALDEPL